MWLRASERAAIAEGAVEGDFVRVVERAAGGEALGKAGDFEMAQRGERTVQVVGGSFAFHVGTHGEDDFRDGGILRPVQQ